MRTYNKNNTNGQTSNVLSWTQILTEAVNTPGRMLEAYTAFHDYSIGNQLLALSQCYQRGIQSPERYRHFPAGRH